MFQKEETSSIAKRSPPTGAPKAEAIPLLKKNNGKKIKCEGNRGNNNAKMADISARLIAGGPAYYVLHPQKGITICLFFNLPGLQKPGRNHFPTNSY